MKYEQEPRPQNDFLIIAVMIGVAIIIFAVLAGVSLFWGTLIIVQLLLAFAAGMIGKDRQIGFAMALFLGLFIPLLGFVFALISTKIADTEYRERMMDTLENNSGSQSSSIADQLFRLNELRKEGVITNEEFYNQKEKLLNG